MPRIFEPDTTTPLLARRTTRNANSPLIPSTSPCPAGQVEWTVLRQVVSCNLVINERPDRFRIGKAWLALPIAGFFEITDEGLISIWRDYLVMATYTRQFAALTSPP